MEEAKSHVRLTVKSQEQALSGRALMTKNIIDDETIEACRRGESDAFRLLFEAYKKLFLNCGNKRKERQMKSTLTRSVIPIALLVVLTAVALSKRPRGNYSSRVGDLHIYRWRRRAGDVLATLRRTYRSSVFRRSLAG
jgi:hypothetical protein